MPLTRRSLLTSAAAGLAAAALPPTADAEPPPRPCRVGLVEYAFSLHRAAARREGKEDLGEPLAFLRAAHRLGAGGIQAALPDVGPERLAPVRRYAEEHGLFVEAILSPPRDAADLDRFDRQVQAARAAGATLARTVILPGRRYEQFQSLAEFRAAEQRGEQMLRRAEPVLARRRFRLAVENHKDQRSSERVDLLRRLNSEWIGACMDLGNSFALVEDPLETARALAPWALTVHLKDQDARPTADGFAYADAALGQGFLDLPALVQLLKKARPGATFSLEVITRDPLSVPVLTDAFWTTLPDVPARDLARTLRTVAARASAPPLPRISPLPPEAQLAAERAHVQDSLRFARDRLHL